MIDPETYTTIFIWSAAIGIELIQLVGILYLTNLWLNRRRTKS